MTPLSQSKVLRVLQDQRFERVGGHDTIQTDVRIITATNRDLEQMVADGTFRADLYYRLKGFCITLPALRERGEDLPLLVRHYIARFRRELGKAVVDISEEAMDVLRRYSWPGNVRQLQSVLRQAILHATGSVLLPDFLPAEVFESGITRSAAPSPGGGEADNGSSLDQFLQSQIEQGTTTLYADALAILERRMITKVLQHTCGNQSQAAKMLGVTRSFLRKKVRQFHISITPVVDVDKAEAEDDDEAVTPAAAE
jgi:two-component system nitrogen regulation response regulator GlnG